MKDYSTKIKRNSLFGFGFGLFITIFWNYSMV
jgi:hypothetical protein